MIRKSPLLALALAMFVSLVPAQDVRNAVTRPALITGNWTIQGSWAFLGQFGIPVMNPCVADACTPEGALRMCGTTGAVWSCFGGFYAALPGGGGGDVTGQASSVDSEIAIFSGTTGKVIKRATGTGYVKVAGGGAGGVFQTPSATIPFADLAGGTNAGSFTFSGGVTLPRQQTLEVCKAGCPYSTVPAALTAITDATTSKRYLVQVGAGNFDEDVTAKSYVEIVGAGPEYTRLRGTGAITVTVPIGITEFSMSDLTVGGLTTVSSTGAESPRTILRLNQVTLGIIDGTESAAGKTTSCYLDSGSVHDVWLKNVTCRTTQDGFRYNTDDSVYGSGTVIEGNSLGSTATMRGWTWTNTGVQISEVGPKVNMVKDATGTIRGIEFAPGSSNNGTRATRFVMSGGDLALTTSGAPSASTISCVNLASSIGVQQANSEITLLGTECSLSDANATWTLQGLRGEVAGSDSDYANLTVRWVGGRIVRVGGSGGSSDVSSSFLAQSTASIYFLGVDGVSSLNALDTPTVQGNYVTAGNFIAQGTWNFTNILPPIMNFVKTVGSGKDYATIGAAITALGTTICTAATPCEIRIDPGTYNGADCGLPVRSYMSFIGMGDTPDDVVLDCPGLTGVVFPSGLRTDGVVFRNLSVLAEWAIETNRDDAINPTVTVIDKCILGVPTSAIGWWDKGAGHYLLMTDSLVQTKLDGIFMRAGSRIVDINNRVVWTHGGGEPSHYLSSGEEAGSPQTWGMSNGASAYIKGLRVSGTMDCTIGLCSSTPFFRVFNIRGATGTNYGPFTLTAEDVSVNVTFTDTGTYPISMLYLGATGANANQNQITLRNVNTTFTETNNSHPIAGVEVLADGTNHGTYSINMIGGSYAATGGSVNYDVKNSDATAGFSINLDRWNHAGNYNGTAAPTITDSGFLRASKQVTLPVGALTCGAGKAGRLAAHTTPLQYCDNAGTPTLQYAAYGNSSGVATSATALAVNGGNCTGNNFALGVDASGAGECAQPAFSNLSGSATDAQIPDTITASSYLPLSAGSGQPLTSQLYLDNLGLEFEESDTNPSCAAGNYSLYADLSEAKFKKCTNGVATDMDTGGSGTPGGSDTQVQFNDAGAFGGDAGMTYVKATDALTAGSFSTPAKADGSNYLEGFGNATTDPGAPASGSFRFYGKGTAGSELPFWRTATGGVVAIQTGIDDDIPEAGDFTNLTGGAGITNTSGTLATASSEQNFLANGLLTCGASTNGKMQVSNTVPLQYCDNQATPVLQYAAYADSTGVATSATALAANGGNCSGNNFALGVDASGVGECAQPSYANLSGVPGADTQVIFNNAGVLAGDAGMTYVAATDALTAGSFTTPVKADGSNYLEGFGNATTAPSAPSSGSYRFYGKGSAGTENPFWRTATAGVKGIALTTQVTIDFGTTGGLIFTSTITGQQWVTSSSIITCSVFATSADGQTIETVLASGVTAMVSNLVAGTGFDVSAYSPNGATGIYRFNCTGS